MRSFPLFASLVVVASAQPAAPSLQNLITNSPFGSAAQAGAMPTSATPLEFRGTFVDNGERFFSILDTASRRAEWVGLNESGRPFLVKNYDPDREAITLEFQGRAMDLKLHSAKIAAAPLPQSAAPVANNAPQSAAGRPVQAAPSTTEAQRLAQVAEEIRRRRALRQQAQQPSANVPNAAPPPANQPPSSLPQPR